MTKKIKKLEKETTQWRTKWESNNQALLQMAEEVTFMIFSLLFESGCFGRLRTMKIIKEKVIILENILICFLSEIEKLESKFGIGPRII